MAGTFWSLFRKSPFRPIRDHMDKVCEAALLVETLFEHLIAGEHEKVQEMARTISQKEAEADHIKSELRSHMPKTLFMPVDRGDLLRHLSTQDSIADCAEDVGVLLTLRQMHVPELLADPLRGFVHGVLECVREAEIGVGLARGIAALDLGGIKRIAASWIITVPFAGGLAAVLFLILRAVLL